MQLTNRLKATVRVREEERRKAWLETSLCLVSCYHSNGSPASLSEMPPSPDWCSALPCAPAPGGPALCFEVVGKLRAGTTPANVSQGVLEPLSGSHKRAIGPNLASPGRDDPFSRKQGCAELIPARCWVLGEGHSAQSCLQAGGATPDQEHQSGPAAPRQLGLAQEP